MILMVHSLPFVCWWGETEKSPFSWEILIRSGKLKARSNCDFLVCSFPESHPWDPHSSHLPPLAAQKAGAWGLYHWNYLVGLLGTGSANESWRQLYILRQMKWWPGKLRYTERREEEFWVCFIGMPTMTVNMAVNRILQMHWRLYFLVPCSWMES